MNDYEIVNNLSKLCEYMYRQGIYDSAMCGDGDMIKEVANRNDNHLTFQLLGSEPYTNSRWELYGDKMVVIAGRLNAPHFRSFMKYKKGMNKLKREMLGLIDEHYRNGLRHGLKRHKHDCIDFYENVRFGSNHDCFLTSGKMVTEVYLDRMKHVANTIQRGRVENGVSELWTNSLIRFMANAIKNR